MTQDEARAAGVKRFTPDGPCKRGHHSDRFVSTGQCCECQLEHRRKWRVLNPEKERASRISSLRRWAKRNPERKRELSRKSNAKPEVSANNVARARRWQEKNPERANIARRTSDAARRAKKRNAGGRHTVEDIAEILRRQKYKCAECGSSVRKVENRHNDHIMPLSLGGSNDKANIQVLCPPCNLRKAAKHPADFARERGRLI